MASHLPGLNPMTMTMPQLNGYLKELPDLIRAQSGVGETHRQKVDRAMAKKGKG